MRTLNYEKTEEIFAYMTSSSAFRKFLGPIIRAPYEIGLFFSLIFMGIASQFSAIFISTEIFSALSVFSFASGIFLFSFALFRLAFIKLKLNRTFKKLFKLTKDKKKARSVLFRLTDNEITNFAKMTKEEIREYIHANKELSLRWKVINSAYFAS